MSDDSRKPPAPRVQVIRRPAGASPAAPVSPTAVPVSPTTVTSVAPHPVAPRPVVPTVVPTVQPTASPSVQPSAVVRPVLPKVEVRPVGAVPPRRDGPPRPAAVGGRPGFKGPPRTGAPRPPPTAEAIAVLARKERVSNRIAKGELEGKMKCRIWKKLHAEEAKRFDQAWVLVEANAGLELADAFGIVQSGLSMTDFMARRARARKREDIKVARATVAGATIEEFIQSLVASKHDAAFVLGERTVLDQLKAVAPVSFELERTGRLEKLNVVVLARKTTWDKVLPTLERDPKLSHKPVPVARQPARRPINDPRVFLEHVGKPIQVVVRNGMTLKQPLLAVGPFDVLLGQVGEELFVPLHAMMSWTGTST